MRVIVHAGESPFKVATAEATEGVPELALKSIVMSLPEAGATTAAVAREFRMFSTEVDERAVHAPQASVKQFTEAPLAGAHPSNTLAGKVIRAVQLPHA